MKKDMIEQATQTLKNDLSKTQQTKEVIEKMVVALNKHRIDDIGEFFEKKFRVILLKKFLSLKFQIAGAMSITPSIGKILFEFIRLKRIAPPMLSPIKYNFFLGYFFFNFVI